MFRFHRLTRAERGKKGAKKWEIEKWPLAIFNNYFLINIDFTSQKFQSSFFLQSFISTNGMNAPAKGAFLSFNNSDQRWMPFEKKQEKIACLPCSSLRIWLLFDCIKVFFLPIPRTLGGKFKISKFFIGSLIFL